MVAAKTMDKFVTQIGVALDMRTGGDVTSEGEVRRRLSTVVANCGWKQRSHPRMEQLQKSLVDAVVYPSEDLTDLSLPLSTTIRFRRQAPMPPAMGFAAEKDLERFLAKNHRLLLAQVESLKGSHHLAGGTKPQRRFAHGRSYVRPDLVFRTPDGTIVVVEVKLGAPDDRAVTQLRQYLTAASKHHRLVRGLLISGYPRSHAHESTVLAEISAVKRHHIDWIRYSADMTLTSVN